MNSELLNTEIQQFILKNQNEEITRILLRKSPFLNVSPKELAQQIEGKNRSQKKLPTWFNTSNIYYPAKISIEQASSELTAKYKSELITGKNVIDITGGFGVDTLYFSKIADQVIHCELNQELSDIALHNSKLLNANNITFFSGDGMDFLSRSDQDFDTIFIDPSRRVNARKVFFLADCEPNVVENLDLMLSKAQRIIIKTSPLLDITSGLNELKHVSEVHIVSVKNDCKEMLWVIDKDFYGEPSIICAILTDDNIQNFDFKQSEEKQIKIAKYSSPLTYLFEPDVALLKAGCFKLISERFNVEKLHQHTHLYTTNNMSSAFPGKTFSVLSFTDYRAFLNDKPVTKANIIVRNFPLSVDELKKKHSLKDGGEDYLIFTTIDPSRLIVIHAKRM